MAHKIEQLKADVRDYFAVIRQRDALYHALKSAHDALAKINASGAYSDIVTQAREALAKAEVQ